MIKYVIQTCDWCGTEGRSSTLGVPEGWFVFDLRGGKEPGVMGFGWNVCSLECMNECIQEWLRGTNPIPYGVPEAQAELDHQHSSDHELPIPVIEPLPVPGPPAPTIGESHTSRRPPCGCKGHGKGSIDDIARASAEVAQPQTRRYMQTDAGMVEVIPPSRRTPSVPLHEQGHGGH